ncbi:Glycosyl hydrolase family 63 C-terminal domain-containing protein [Filimonas lacunae]|uniref:Glycosyl hydrolase family 63 C-terminal domain-containing protein n=1 Tax=Filimonas lacunae TaxID=477680 RepID=A0A173MPA5_9BACT|nr:glucosidase [Filimonas lacunae]BAV09198.1 acyl-coenzyme A synthetase [Filimonas lacunae]SIS68793.1 Glycosyl hydrolase family 63 C-terminal domain-containing protein [Filimonas lacunae]
MSAEQQRLKANAGKKIALEQWGPYLSDRQWGTVREDYSENGDAWNYFPFSHSHSRAYRWGEDGIGGISDFFQNLCFSVALWNGKDPILKERLFGLGNYEGNHGEDVKELYYYLDNLPSHYYMQMLYKYPQQAFPYDELLEKNRSRTKLETEYELLDTGAFKDNKYFDVYITYAKHNKRDIAIKIEVVNRGKTEAPITVIPTLWFYNRWQYGGVDKKPQISRVNDYTVKAKHERLGNYYLYFQKPEVQLFTENETNNEKLFKKPNVTPYVKDAFHDAIIHKKNVDSLKKLDKGTKFAPVYSDKIKPGGSKTYYLRLSESLTDDPFGHHQEHIFEQRKAEADEFYKAILPKNISAELRTVQRQALAGLLWSKQYYHFDIERWLSQPDGISPNQERQTGRNHDWQHLKNQDIIAMPDKWEYPWYAAWDLAFHCIPMAMVDPVFAKHQLVLIMREWYMKPDGQLPAYEWNFSDVNPPVHAWAALQVYHIEKKQTGKGDIPFLKRIFQKLLINFTWWINRKDPNGNNIFEGGFLGLDNIGVFNRSIQLHGKMALEQADGTSWMGMYALNLMDMAIEIAMHDISFEDTATKFFEHFVLIAEALNELGMWDNEDKFFYDMLVTPGAQPLRLKIQSIVGLTPLFAVSVIERNVLRRLDDFTKRITWFENYRLRNNKFWPNEERTGGEKILLSLIPKEKLVALLQRLLNETEFLSTGGIRALSKYHEKHPYTVTIDETEYSIQYDPGDSTSNFFGGNSNWRGPVWMPINYLIIEAIKKFGDFYEEGLTMEYPTGSGKMMTLKEIADELTQRVISLFEKDVEGKRKLHGEYNWFYQQAGNEHLILFYEYFHGDTGSGLGASHQTGWTALVAELLNETAEQHKEVPTVIDNPARPK